MLCDRSTFLLQRPALLVCSDEHCCRAGGEEVSATTLRENLVMVPTTHPITEPLSLCYPLFPRTAMREFSVRIDPQALPCHSTNRKEDPKSQTIQ